MDTFEMIADERRQLADELDTLTDEQWATPSLCGSWTVRDVAAHLTTPFTVAGPSFFVGIVTSGFNFDKANDKISRREAQKPTDEIIDNLRTNAEHRFTPPASPPEAPLTDILVHGQDIRRPLGLSHEFAADHLRRALDFVASGKARGFVSRSRVQGLRFVATDVDWAAGPSDGAEVRGSGEALLLAITGRAVALDELEGDGVAALRQRLR